MGSKREGATLDAVARYTGIPKDTLKWLAGSPLACMNVDRQRYLSKVVAEIENGIVAFRRLGRKKIAVRPEAPKPIARYAVTIGKRGARLAAVDRPAPSRGMPSFRDALLK